MLVVSLSLWTRDFHGQITSLQLHRPCRYDTIHRRFIATCTRCARCCRFNRFLSRASFRKVDKRVPFRRVAPRQLDRFDFAKLTKHFSQLPFQIFLVQCYAFGWNLPDVHRFTLRQ
jgi:epoxyqueuosine reductase QueG